MNNQVWALIGAGYLGWLARGLATSAKAYLSERPRKVRRPRRSPSPEVVARAVQQAQVVDAQRAAHIERDPDGEAAYSYLTGTAVDAMRKTVSGGDDT